MKIIRIIGMIILSAIILGLMALTALICGGK